MNAKKDTKWYMAGTEGTGEYLVVVQGSLGRVGYRNLRSGQFRVRVEPADTAAQVVMTPSFQGWKQPGDSQLRFSTVVGGTTNALEVTVGEAIKALAAANHLVVNPKAPKWAKELVKTVTAEMEAAAKAAEEAKKAAEAKAKAAPKPKKPAAKKAPAKKAPAKKVAKKAA